MSTVVFVHAHPDDEASATAGSMARAAAEGHRVVLVVATNGDHGEVPEDLAPGETVVDRRRRETQRSADLLGITRLVWLGFTDSGMTGWAQNADPDCLMATEVDVAAKRLVAVLDEEDADLVVGYDWHGGYGHPDHIAVHRLTRRAVELAARRPRLLEVTMNRDRMREMFLAAKAAGMTGGPDGDWDPDAPADDGNPIGTPQAEIDLAVDVSDYLELKRASLQCHASQTSDVGMMLSIPPEPFAMMFGVEHYIDPSLDDVPRPPGTPRMQPGWIFTR